VWCAELDVAEARQRQLQTFLTDDERARAARFRFSRDRERFIACRGQLRELLAVYLHTHPRMLQFSANEFGKPSLARRTHARLPSFNVSHSRDLALYAVTSGTAVGVDIEHLRTMDDMLSLSRRYFTPREQRKIESRSEEERELAFFECWTRKEALLKAWGRGVSLPLEQVDAAPGLSNVPRLLGASVPSDLDPVGWTIFPLRPVDGCVAALATRARTVTLECWRW
jgi:4'-phosphopantetheinyl transferase